MKAQLSRRLIWFKLGVFLALLALALLCAPSPHSSAQKPQANRQLDRQKQVGERRVALVIGNGAYQNASRLANPVNDATDIATALRELGFELVGGRAHVNQNADQMKRLIIDFGEMLSSGGAGLFYYAGHGVQSQGHNYLIPVEANLLKEKTLEFDAVDVNRVLAQMDAAGNGFNIVILDACRNNPFSRSWRDASQGLAQVNAPEGTLIAYATSPGRVASDGNGTNGTYTAELLRKMREPGLKIEETFKAVRAGVKSATKNEQTPWESSSLVGDFYFTVSNEAATLPKPRIDTPKTTEVLTKDAKTSLLTEIDSTTTAERVAAKPPVPNLQMELKSTRLGSSYDVTNYRIEAQLLPSQQLLRAASDITFVPLDPTRSITFELNGSLVVESIEREGQPLTNFVQDRSGASEIGPNVRVDLDEVVPAGQPVTLRFRWSGALISADGGPLVNKRLAYVGTEGSSYLMYAARWFPFHSYAADLATADITVIVPTGLEVAGASDEPITPQSNGNTTRFRFVQRRPTLIGNLIAGKYVVRDLRVGSYELRFCVQPSGEKYVEHYADLIGRALQFYTQQYGTPAFGSRLTVAQIDDESLNVYSASGMVFLSTKSFEGAISDEALLREVGTQWWGHTVGMKTFDDAWLSQGLAQWSAHALQETTLTGDALKEAENSLEKRALRFSSTVSIVLAPSSLDDQSEAYESIVFYKGAVVFRRLRESMGREKFNKLLRSYLEQYRGRNASIKDFEELTNKIAGEDMHPFFALWLETKGFGDGAKHAENADKLLGEQKFLEAESEYRLALRAEPNNAIYHEGLGWALSRQRKDVEAENEFREALKLEPSRASLHYGLASTLQDQLRYTEAEKEKREAVRLEPTKAVYRSGLSNILYFEKKYAEAENEIREAIRLDPSESRYQEFLQLILKKKSQK